MPDRSRYPWLPRQNVVDPSIFTQLDPKRKLPTPDGAPLPDNDLSAQDKNKITIKPGAGPAPGGGIGPPVTPGPSIPTLPAPPGSGQTHNPPPPQTPPFPTVSIGPMGTPPGASGPVGPPVNPMPAGIPPQATPSDPNLNTSTVTYPGLGPTPAPPTNPNPVELPPFPSVSTGPVTRPGGTGTTGTPPSIPLPQMPTMSVGPTGGGGGEPSGGGEAPPEPGYLGPPSNPFPEPIQPVATPMPSPDQLTDVDSNVTYGDIVPDGTGGGSSGDPDETKDDEGDADWDYEAMAKGGIIRRPTRVKLGEAGPEAVVPVGPKMKYNWRAR